MDESGVGRGEMGQRRTAYSVTGCINDTFYSAADGLEGIGANTRGTLRDAFDSLARFGREVLCCFTAERRTDKESAIILLVICLCRKTQSSAAGLVGGSSVRGSIGLFFQVTAVFGSRDDVEVDGAIFEYFDHG